MMPFVQMAAGKCHTCSLLTDGDCLVLGKHHHNQGALKQLYKSCLRGGILVQPHYSRTNTMLGNVEGTDRKTGLLFAEETLPKLIVKEK